jgi:protein-disulfide isomerase-like protein with CxxC motif
LAVVKARKVAPMQVLDLDQLVDVQHAGYVEGVNATIAAAVDLLSRPGMTTSRAVRELLAARDRLHASKAA